MRRRWIRRTLPTGGGRGGGGGGGGRGGPPAAVPVGFPAGGEGGGGRGGAPLGPLVMPGTYSVRVDHSGRGERRSSGTRRSSKPIRCRSSARPIARRVRRLLMRIYEWTKTFGEARAAARSLVAQRDSIAADFSAGGAADGRAKADSLNARIARCVGRRRPRVHRGERTARADRERGADCRASISESRSATRWRMRKRPSRRSTRLYRRIFLAGIGTRRRKSGRVG